VRRLFRHVLVYGTGRLALQLVAFVTLPVLTRIFTPADYGVIEAIATTVGIVALLGTLSLDQAAQRTYYDYSDDDVAERTEVLSSAFWTAVTWSGVLAFAVVLLRRPVSELLFGTDAYATIVALAVAALPISIATTFVLEVMRLRHQPGRYVLTSWFGAALSVTLILTFVAGFDGGLEGFYLAGIVSALPTLAVALALTRMPIRGVVKPARLRSMLVFALPLVPVALTTWLTQYADRYFVLHFASLRELGHYAIGGRLANVLLFALGAFAFAWSPFALELMARDPERERAARARALVYVAIAAGFGAICLSVYSREFLRTVTDPAFEDAYKVVGILCLGAVAAGLSAVLGTGITIARKTGYFARYAFYAAALNLTLNVLLVPPLGMVGAAIAAASTYTMLAVVYYRRAQLLDPAPFAPRRVLAIVLVAAALIAVGSSFTLDPVWMSVLAKLPLVALFPLTAWLLGWLDPEARAVLRLPAPALR
jgi:O-antigen/teichoic acid export membrane protein